MNGQLRHYENSALITASAKEVFDFTDNPLNLSKHMEKPKPQMLWGWMRNTLDEKGGREVGSVIRMKGNVLGINLSLEEVIIERTVNKSKSWKTNWVNLVVIGNYTMGFGINPVDTGSKLTVFINYALPESGKTRWLGNLFGDMYARWCVHQMLKDTTNHFGSG
jgi:hypothetical protein